MIQIGVGDEISFAEDPHSYRVQAISGDGRWAVATRPTTDQDDVDPDSTELYTVIDTHDEVRGVDNYGGLGYQNRDECQAAIALFESGQAEHSLRNRPIPLRITRHLSAATSTADPTEHAVG